MSRTVMTHLDNAITEVQRLKFGERSACTEAIHDEHRERRAKLELPDDGYTARGEQRRAEDHPSAQALVDLTLETAVVVGDRIKREIVDEAVETDGNLCGPSKIVGVDATVELKDLARKFLSGRDLCLRDRVDSDPLVVELHDLHVTTEMSGDHREVCRDVEHSGVQVTHRPVTRIAQGAAHTGGLDPPIDTVPCVRVLEIARHRPERNAAPLECIRHLG